MSYLSALRLHFAGQFQASVSTVNNDPVHFDNSRFRPEYQDRQTRDAYNGWFNPRGDANWRLLGCKVSGAWLAPGLQAPEDDPVRTYLVADSDSNVAAKLVDLDPEQQLVSMVFGLEVRLTTPAGGTVVRGRFEPAPFTDIWSRSTSRSGGDTDAGASYQSVLGDLEWGDIASSPFLTRLYESAAEGLLSIKFNVDSFNMTFSSPEFMRGRVVGTIGPAGADEPHQLVLGRHFLTTSKPTNGFFAPEGNVNFCVAKVDRALEKIYLDLGNALPTAASGAPVDQGPITLACIVQTHDGPRVVSIDSCPAATYTDPAWYPATAGVMELPSNRELTAEELEAVAANPLAIFTSPSPGSAAVAISEPPGGEYVRADQFVFRMSPGDHARARLYATQFGEPYPGARIIVLFEPSQLQSQAGSPDLGPAPPVASPAGAIHYSTLVTADPRGVADLPIAASNPGNPRGYIDGQVYGLRPVLEDTVFSPGSPYPFNPSDFISVLVWDDLEPREEPLTWFGTIQPILQQFENLYPVMKRFVRLGDYESVCHNRRELLYAFGLDVANPNSMPVTRDLSPAKRAAIVSWLSDVGTDGNPLEGTPRAEEMVSPGPGAPQPVETGPAAGDRSTQSGSVRPPGPAERAEHAGAEGGGPAQGGKAAALGRRLGVARGRALPPGTALGGIE